MRANIIEIILVTPRLGWTVKRQITQSLSSFDIFASLGVARDVSPFGKTSHVCPPLMGKRMSALPYHVSHDMSVTLAAQGVGRVEVADIAKHLPQEAIFDHRRIGHAAR